jgi:tetratricopeptide (TPR) repeat protein
VARGLWERAAAVAPKDPRFPYSLGLSYARDAAPGSVDRAGQAFDEALRRAPRYAPAYVQLGLLFQRHRRYRDAARHLLQAIEITPTDPEPHRHLADTLAALGERAEAVRRRGLYYSLSDQPARAILEYEQLQAIDPGGIDAPLLISQSCVQMRQNERAVAVLEQALKRQPRNPVLSERLATLYVLLHSPKEAEATCREWLRGDPEAARARWVLGRAAYADHRIEEAARQYEEALTRAPGEAEFCFALGGALEQLAGADRRPRALALLGRAVELKPDVPEYRYRLGVAYQQRGEWEPARRELLATLDLDPRHAGAYNALTQVAQGVRQPHQVRLWAEAMRAVQDRQREETSDRLDAGARPRDPAVWFALAQTLLRAGELEKAQGQLEQSLWLRPDWPEARRALARVAALRAVM